MLNFEERNSRKLRIFVNRCPIRINTVGTYIHNVGRYYTYIHNCKLKILRAILICAKSILRHFLKFCYTAIFLTRRLIKVRTSTVFYELLVCIPV